MLLATWKRCIPCGVFAFYSLGAVSTCDECTKTSNQEIPPETTETTPTTEPLPTFTTNADGNCEVSWDRPFSSTYGIRAVCFDGTYGLDMVSGSTVTTPCQSFDYNGVESQLPSNEFNVEASDPGYMCNPGTGAGTWTGRFPPGPSSTCSDYTFLGENYVELDQYGVQFLSNAFGVACAFVNYTGGYYAAASYDKLPSAATDCTPGSATFKLASRGVSTDDGGKVSIWLAPLATQTARFPERAWMRRIEISDWGSIDNLHIARFGEYLRFAGAQVTNGRTLSRPGTAFNFAVGDAPMSTMFAVAGATLGSGFELPTVQITWSCEVDASHPHFVPIAENGYVAPLPPSTGIGQRVVLWLDWAHDRMRIAPEGDFAVYDVVKLVRIGAASAHFAGRLASYDANYAGTITMVDGNLRLTDATATVAGVHTVIPDTTFVPLH